MSSTLAELHYLIPTPRRPRTYTYQPEDGSPRSTVRSEPHRVAIHDLRQGDREYALDSDGFAHVPHDTKVTDFGNEADIRDIYYREAEDLLKQVTGGDRVFIFDHTLRHYIPDHEDDRDGPHQPVARVHVDHTATSGPQRVRDLLPEEAEELLKGRVQVINLWRPINHPVYDRPLAVAEAGSINADELIPSDLVYPHRVGETYNVVFSPEHRWHYLSRQRPDEVLLLKCFDSRTDVARFAPHTAFVESEIPAGTPPRESIELRALVFNRS